MAATSLKKVGMGEIKAEKERAGETFGNRSLTRHDIKRACYRSRVPQKMGRGSQTCNKTAATNYRITKLQRL